MRLDKDEERTLSLVMTHTQDAAGVVHDLMRGKAPPRGIPLPGILRLYNESDRHRKLANEAGDRGSFRVAFEYAMTSYGLMFQALQLVRKATR